MFTHTSTHLNFSWPAIKSTHINLKYILIHSKSISKVGNQKAPFSIATTPRCRGGRRSFPGLLHFTFDTYLILLSDNQEGSSTIQVEGNPKAPFSIATTPRCWGGRYSFPGLLYFTLVPYLIMLSVKQGGIKYHFLSLWYDSTWDWTQSPRPLANTSWEDKKGFIPFPRVFIWKWM